MELWFRHGLGMIKLSWTLYAVIYAYLMGNSFITNLLQNSSYTVWNYVFIFNFLLSWPVVSWNWWRGQTVKCALVTEERNFCNCGMLWKNMSHSLLITDHQRSSLLAVQLRDENSTDRWEPMSARMMDGCKHMVGVCLPRCLDLQVQLHKHHQQVMQAASSPQVPTKYQCQCLCIAALWLKRSLAWKWVVFNCHHGRSSLGRGFSILLLLPSELQLCICSPFPCSLLCVLLNFISQFGQFYIFFFMLSMLMEVLNYSYVTMSTPLSPLFYTLFL